MRPILLLLFGLLAYWFAATLGHAAVLERGNGPEPDSLDPQRAQGLAAQSILRDLFEGLTRVNGFGEIEPAIALSWSTSEDGLRWRFQLDPNARYSDGTPITTSDFVYAFERALFPMTAAPYASQLESIVGASERLAGQDSAPLGVLALAPHDLEIQLKRPNAALASILSLPIAAPVQRACFEKHGDQCIRANRLPSTGAYRLIAWRPLGSVLLEKNPHYSSAKSVTIERVRFHVTEDASEEARRFATGELHLTETVPPGRLAQLREKFCNQLRVAPSLGTFFLGYNLSKAPFADSLKLREALSLALDRDRIVSIITGTGERPAWGLLPPELRASGSVQTQETNETRIKRAQALYQAAGYSQKNPLEVELRYNTTLLNRRLMLAVSLMWEQNLGVRTILRNEEWKVFVQNRRAKRNTQVFRGGWNADLADPLNFLELYASGSHLNYSGYANPGFDAELANAKIAPDWPARLASAERAEAILRQDFALLPIFHYTSKHLVSKKLAGFVENPLDVHPSRSMQLLP
jgi:oligopeptide transport system substrate-binding protein